MSSHKEIYAPLTFKAVVTQGRSGSSSLTSTELLKQLKQVHWLPIEWYIRFKLATFKALHTGHLPYLADLLQYHKTTKSA